MPDIRQRDPLNAMLCGNLHPATARYERDRAFVQAFWNLHRDEMRHYIVQPCLPYFGCPIRAQAMRLGVV